MCSGSLSYSSMGVRYLGGNPDNLLFWPTSWLYISKKSLAFRYNKTTESKTNYRGSVIYNGLPIIEPFLKIRQENGSESYFKATESHREGY